MIPAETAVRAWGNSKTSLVGPGNPLSNGIFLREQRSPADGQYAIVARAQGSSDLVAEQDTNLCAAMMAFTVYGGTEGTAEAAAAALASEIEQLTGRPEPCGGTGVTVLVADKLAGPVHMPAAPDAGELYCFTVQAEFTLAQM